MSSSKDAWNLVGIKTAIIGLGASVIISVFTVRFLSRIRKQQKYMKIIDTIEEFQRADVCIRNPQRVEEIVCQLIRGGRSKLQVIADFDHTLSRFHKNGKRCDTCHGALSNSHLMPQNYQEQTKVLYNRYHAIEIDPKITLEDKAPYMREWWDKSHELFMQCAFNKSAVERVVKESNLHLRSGCGLLFETLCKYEIPLLVLSAGLGDLLVEAIKQQVGIYDNITFVANFMKFDNEGISTGFKGDTIHSCNKDSRAMKNTGYFEKHSERTNVILLGDSIGDLRMVEGFQNAEVVLKIGFLNEKIEEALPQYKDGYDIVLVDNQTLDLVNALLKKILL